MASGCEQNRKRSGNSEDARKWNAHPPIGGAAARLRWRFASPRGGRHVLGATARR